MLQPWGLHPLHRRRPSLDMRLISRVPELRPKSCLAMTFPIVTWHLFFELLLFDLGAWIFSWSRRRLDRWGPGSYLFSPIECRMSLASNKRPSESISVLLSISVPLSSSSDVVAQIENGTAIISAVYSDTMTVYRLHNLGTIAPRK